jgi:hypothetical protein
VLGVTHEKDESKIIHGGVTACFGCQGGLLHPWFSFVSLWFPAPTIHGAALGLRLACVHSAFDFGKRIVESIRFDAQNRIALATGWQVHRQSVV